MAGDEKTLYQELTTMDVAESLVSDAIKMYATQEIVAGDERDAFVTKYSADSYSVIIKAAAVMDVIMCIVAAQKAPNDTVFIKFIDMLSLEESDPGVEKMKLSMLDKMIDDAIEDIEEEEQSIFLKRITIVRTRFS